MNRYFLKAGAWGEDTLTLTDEEAHHAARVMRVNAGDQIEIFDGEGKSAVCLVTQVTRTEVTCSIESTKDQPPNKHPITLCQAVPKGSNMELIVQKAVELGIRAIQPLITTNTVARPDAADKKQAKWQRIALEACKQCGQNHLPKILPPLTFSDWIQTNSPANSKFVAALCPESTHLKNILSNKPITGSVELLIGPEGDLSQEEYQQAFDASFLPVSFGDIILRVETASIYGISILQHELSSLS